MKKRRQTLLTANDAAKRLEISLNDLVCLMLNDLDRERMPEELRQIIPAQRRIRSRYKLQGGGLLKFVLQDDAVRIPNFEITHLKKVSRLIRRYYLTKTDQEQEWGVAA